MSTPAYRSHPPQSDAHQPQQTFSATFAPEQPWIPEGSPPLSPGSYDRLARSIVSEHRRLQRERDPRLRPLPPVQAQKPAGWKLPVTIVGTVLFAGAASYYALDKIWLQKMWSSSMGDQIIQLAASTADGKRRNPADPRLVADGAVMESDDEILVGAVAEGPVEGASAVISGLAPGSLLSNGTPWGATGWLLPAAELAQTTIRPPQNFKGTMEYSVTLKRADNTVIDQKNIRLDWNPKTETVVARADLQPVKVQTTTIPRAQTEQAPPAPPPAEMAAEEVALILKRGEKMLMSGDLAGARLLFRRAADARSADAAYALAATYDPAVLKRLGVLGVGPDIARARDWYEKAREYGSKEAPKRLEELVSLGR
jgi:hypothetical protein